MDKIICTVSGTNGGIWFTWEQDGINHERILTDEFAEKLQNLGLDKPHDVFVVEEVGGKPVLRAYDSLKDDDLDNLHDQLVINSILKYKYTEMTAMSNVLIEHIKRFAKHVIFQQINILL